MKNDSEIDKELSICDAALFEIGREIGSVRQKLLSVDESCAFEVGQVMRALDNARVRIKQSIEKPVLPTLKEIQDIYKLYK